MTDSEPVYLGHSGDLSFRLSVLKIAARNRVLYTVLDGLEAVDLGLIQRVVGQVLECNPATSGSTLKTRFQRVLKRA